MVIHGSTDHGACARLGFVVFVFASNGKNYELLYCNNNLSLLTARYRHQQATVGWLTQLFHMRRLLTRVSELSLEVEWSRHETNTILQKEHRSEGTVNIFRPFVSMSIISRKITL